MNRIIKKCRGWFKVFNNRLLILSMCMCKSKYKKLWLISMDFFLMGIGGRVFICCYKECYIWCYLIY